MNDLPVLPHTKKFEKPDEFKDFLIYDSGTDDAEKILTFGQQTLLELLEPTQHLFYGVGILDCKRCFRDLILTFRTFFGSFKRKS